MIASSFRAGGLRGVLPSSDILQNPRVILLIEGTMVIDNGLGPVRYLMLTVMENGLGCD
jgi:hypothetical protein